MDKSYSPRDIESRIYAAWEAAGWFAPVGDGTPYCIVIPPPNVTGTLHMGHAFQHTLMDVLTRLHRMDGDRTLWQPGTDHAGIATQMVVERQLAADGKTRHDLGREKFVERVWEWKEESGGTISRQMRRLGNSVDWSRDRFTMDEGLSAAVLEVFVRLHEDGLIYRGKRLVNWDPVLHTALSDLEVIAEPEAGSLWHLRYPLADGSGHLIVATTRPETMLGDTAVAVNPEDERYQHLVGQQVRLPLTGRLVPIIADDYCDPAFGSGCVKITPAHDFNDYEIGKRHSLPMINILTADAALNDEVPAQYRGLDRFEARKRVVADLEAAGLLEKVDPHTLPVPRGDRSGAVLEPWLTDQWYVRIAPLAAPAIAAVEDGRIRFVPDNWSKTYFQWMRNIQDWCISRQLWWGHRIPAWYDAGRQHLRRAQRGGGAGRRDAAARQARGAAPGRGRARHVVQFGAVAVLDARLAAADARTRGLLPDVGAGHRLRHHLLLGGPDDHDGPQVPGRRALPRGLHHRAHPRRARQQDVEVEGQHHRPARPHRRHRPGDAGRQAHHRPDAAADEERDREGDAQAVPAGHPVLRHRCAALHLRGARHDGSRHPLRPRPCRGLPQFLQQAVERGALRADEHRGARGGHRERPVRVLRRGPLDPRPPRRRGGQRAFQSRGLSLRPRRAGDVRIRLVRILRLVPGTVEARAAGGRRGSRRTAWHAPHAARGARRHAAHAAPADAFHHRRDLAEGRAARRTHGAHDHATALPDGC